MHVQVNEEKEARKVAAARLALAGVSCEAEEDASFKLCIRC